MIQMNGHHAVQKGILSAKRCLRQTRISAFIRTADLLVNFTRKSIRPIHQNHSSSWEICLRLPGSWYWIDRLGEIIRLSVVTWKILSKPDGAQNQKVGRESQDRPSILF